VEKARSRKKIITRFILLHVLTGIPVIFIPYLTVTHRVSLLIALVTVFNGLSALTGPAWSSLMTDYIPHRMRGRYFGWRSRIFAFVVIACSFSAGLILHYRKSELISGFMIIFSMAVACRFVSWYFLTRMYEPLYRSATGAHFGFLEFLGRVRESNFTRFVLFVACLQFCVNLVAPFFPVFMLRDLKFSYLTYTCLTIIVAISGILTIGRWGRYADRVGNMKVVRLSSFLIGTLPVCWLISRNPVYLIFVQILGGFAWAGFNLCAVNFIYDAVRPEKRVRCIAYFNVCSGVAVCAGALLGGQLAHSIPALMGYRILSLCLISALLRYLVMAVFLRRIREVRPAEQMSSRDLFYSVLGLHAFAVSSRTAQTLKQEEA
jgi:MFS family permease